MNKKILGLFVVLLGSFFVFGVMDVSASIYGAGDNEFRLLGYNKTTSTEYIGESSENIRAGIADFTVLGAYFPGSVRVFYNVPNGGESSSDDTGSGGTVDDYGLCSGETLSIFRFIGRVLSIFRIVIPLLIIILGTVDLGKAIAANDENAIKKGTNSLIKRAILGVAIFFLPAIVYMIFNLIDEASETSPEFTQCGICLTRPSSC